MAPPPRPASDWRLGQDRSFGNQIQRDRRHRPLRGKQHGARIVKKPVEHPWAYRLCATMARLAFLRRSCSALMPLPACAARYPCFHRAAGGLGAGGELRERAAQGSGAQGSRPAWKDQEAQSLAKRRWRRRVWQPTRESKHCTQGGSQPSPARQRVFDGVNKATEHSREIVEASRAIRGCG